MQYAPPMHAAEQIRSALAHVAELRGVADGAPMLRQALVGIRDYQARRFESTYADLAADSVHGPATAFFLQELYGGKDYADRDGQFARVANRLEQTLPQEVVATAALVAQLHATSEALDHTMAQTWLELVPDLARAGAPVDARSYLAAWRAVGRRDDRLWQLQTVLSVGQTLSRLTRKKALGWMLRLMHVPAQAAGLGALHQFLVLGFDTFGAMAAHPGGAARFIGTIAQREAGWIQALFDDDPRQAQQKLEQLLPSLSSNQAVRGP